MMSLKENLEKEMRESLKARDSFKLGVVRFLLAQIKNREIDAKRPLADEEIFKIIQTLAKQRKESMIFSEKAGRADLVEKEKMELGLLESYLPQGLSDEDLSRIIVDSIKEIGAVGLQDLGKVMKALMPKVSGKADGSKVNALVKKLLTV
jgi:uncharacterized protein YqeY